MKKSIIMMAAVVFLLSCTEPHSSFSVRNESSSYFYVQYCTNTAIYSCDGLPDWSPGPTATVSPGFTNLIYSTRNINMDGKPNWWKNYQLLITKIVNANGDTVTINSNSPSNWVRHTSGNQYDYVLTISDESFQR